MRAPIELPLCRGIDLLYAALPQGDKSKAARMTIKGGLPYWALLTLLAAFGLAGLVIPAWRDWTWDHGVITAVGTAFLVAAILGATIDRWMKTAIAADVFKAAFEYVMPEEFHAEIRQIISFRFMCEQHEMWYDVHALGVETVSVRVRCERKLRNITSSPHELNGSIHIDDWGFPHSSAIHRCEIHDIAGHLLKRMGEVEIRGDSTLKAETESILVAPGGYYHNCCRLRGGQAQQRSNRYGIYVSNKKPARPR